MTLALCILGAMSVAGGALAQNSAATGAAAEARAKAFEATIAAKIAELGVTPKTVTVPSDRSLETTAAIKQGDYVRATQIAKEMAAQSKLVGTRFYPFNDYVATMARSADPVLHAHLDDWLKRDPKSAYAHMIRGLYYRRVAWATRGGESPDKLPADAMPTYKQDMARSIDDLQEALRLDPRIPLTYYELERTAVSSGDGALASRTFQSGTAAFPEYLPLYQLRLETLEPTQGGSIDAMYTFVGQSVSRAGPKSLVRILYLAMNQDFMSLSSSACTAIRATDRKQCVNAAMAHLTRPELVDGILSALKLYPDSTPYDYSTAVWPILKDMVCNPCYGSTDAVGVIAETLAGIMGTNLQLADEHGKNNYMLEDVTAWTWTQLHNDSNSDQKFRQALEDVERTAFPLEIEKIRVKTEILDDMAQAAEKAGRYEDSIAYSQAANLVGGINHAENPTRQCHLLWKSHHPAEAVKECSRLIEADGNNLDVINYRAMAYQDLQRWDDSLVDLRLVMAAPSNELRVAAAINMSLAYGKKGDPQGQLDEMNSYPYIFDEKLQSAEDLTIVYNNRCYAYMELKQYEKALKDCETSLKHGRLPDALSKEQKLLKILGGHNE